MKVFKFGGASVKDAEGVRNVAKVLSHFPDDDLLIVVSAMGKTTNALEAVVWDFIADRDASARIQILREFHMKVAEQVAGESHWLQRDLQESFDELVSILSGAPSDCNDRDYDAIVAFGEIWSSLIVAAHVADTIGSCSWFDARDVVKTDALHRAARVDWQESQRLCDLEVNVDKAPSKFQYPIMTQGFIGSTKDGHTTTLGREGSDFSAAIFAYLLDAESVTIWKDVPGMFNADPNRFPDTKLLHHVSYREAIELSYFGASVIHPRTLQPLQKKNIPLYVRSFIDLDAPGSTIGEATDHDTLIPSFIVKPGQLLISIIPRDLSFIVEENLSHIFGLFARRNVRIDLMQNNATAFNAVVDDTPRAHDLIGDLHAAYEVRSDEGCELLTVRHYDDATLEKLLAGREVLIEQRSRSTARFVLK